MQRLLLALGLLLIVAALLWPLLQKAGLGRLPGDILIQRGDLRLYLPITSCLVVSVLLSLILWLFRR